MRREIQNMLRGAFLPEFLNRIDETIIFHPLGRSEIKQIVEIQIRRLQTQLAEAELTLKVSDAAKERLAEEGFDPAYGARPLKRVIQQRLANSLATAVLEQKVNPSRSGRDRLERPRVHVQAGQAATACVMRQFGRDTNQGKLGVSSGAGVADTGFEVGARVNVSGGFADLPVGARGGIDPGCGGRFPLSSRR